MTWLIDDRFGLFKTNLSSFVSEANEFQSMFFKYFPIRNDNEMIMMMAVA